MLGGIEIFLLLPRRVGRAVERGGLENRWGSYLRGFESLTLRFNLKIPLVNAKRDFLFAIAMVNLSNAENQVQRVTNFKDLISAPFQGEINAICWHRQLKGDFAEIVNKLELDGNITVVDQEQLLNLSLSGEGQLAREILLQDWKLLEEHGASPVLNVILNYDRDDCFPFFPTDVYSFHVDRSPVPTDTFLCTYYGEASEKY